MNEWYVLAFVALPFLGLLVWSIAEVVTRDDLQVRGRIGWIVFVVLLPVIGLAVYVVVRPPRGAAVSGGESDTSRAEMLVLLAERRQRGELTDDAYSAEIAAVAAQTDRKVP